MTDKASIAEGEDADEPTTEYEVSWSITVWANTREEAVIEAFEYMQGQVRRPDDYCTPILEVIETNKVGRYGREQFEMDPKTGKVLIDDEPSSY